MLNVRTQVVERGAQIRVVFPVGLRAREQLLVGRLANRTDSRMRNEIDGATGRELIERVRRRFGGRRRRGRRFFNEELCKFNAANSRDARGGGVPFDVGLRRRRQDRAFRRS